MNTLNSTLAGQHAVVTGGGSGIGRCTAHEIAALGAHVVITGRKADKLASVQGSEEEAIVTASLPREQLGAIHNLHLEFWSPRRSRPRMVSRQGGAPTAAGRFLWSTEVVELIK